jgi:hypothetical protein
MERFKEMKFNIGNDERLSGLVRSALFSLGYYGNACGPYLYAESSGRIMSGSSEEFFEEDENEEINIDWMRSHQQETIDLGGQTYIKSELEEALKHIKPIGTKS